MTSAHSGLPARAGCRRASLTDIPALVSSIGRSPIVLAGARRSVPSREAAAEGPTPVAAGAQSWAQSWALRQPSGDVDAEVLRWIASHVKGRKRLGLA